jgi:hypothetical protein
MESAQQPNQPSPTRLCPSLSDWRGPPVSIVFSNRHPSFSGKQNRPRALSPLPPARSEPHSGTLPNLHHSSLFPPPLSLEILRQIARIHRRSATASPATDDKIRRVQIAPCPPCSFPLPLSLPHPLTPLIRPKM